jgi:hypothetical protein
MPLLGDLVRHLSAAVLGVFFGSQLTEGLVLVPYWRALPPEEFLRWYAANDARLVRYFGPLTTVTALLAVAAALVTWWQGHPGGATTLLAAAIMIAIVASFFVYFERANRSFATAAITAPAVDGELARWNAWHWMRTLLAGVAFAAALVAT